jgi:TctA family transporter
MSFLTDLTSNAALGLQTALSLNNLLFCALGVTLGTFLGAMPGIGVLVAMSLLFPLTFHLEPTAALVMLGGIYYGTAYGGSIASILLNVPGTPANAVACLDGYPMAQQGRAAVALSTTAVASFIGGSIGIALMMLFAPMIAQYALKFGPAEYFALMVLGLVTASTISEGAPVKGVAMCALGVALGLVGTDLNTGVQRFTFDLLSLRDGLSLVAIAMGLFGVAELIATVMDPDAERRTGKIRMRDMIPTRDDMGRMGMPILRGAGIGSFIGVLPGAGALIASFMSYAVEKKLAKEPERFGKGAIEGVVGPESANNACDQTAFIPTLSLGIPGSPALALILGVLLIHGISPGPSMVNDHPEMFWGLIMSFWIGNLLLLILNIPLVGIWVRLLMVPKQVLYPAVIFFICIGVYTVSYNAFDIWLVIAFGIVGYTARLLGFPPAPLVLGLVLGPLMEIHFRRTMIFSGGDFSAFVTRPISGTVLALSAAVLVWIVWSSMRRPKSSTR